MTAPQLVVIPCGGVKLDHAAPADQLYVGGYFLACLRLARALVPDDRIRVLSALHGFLELHAVVEPYDVRFGQLRAVTVEQLRRQAAAQQLDQLHDVVALGGRQYRDAALAVWPDAVTPLAGFPGIGYQLRELRRLTDQLVTS